jgi:hypothetical protein
LIHIQLVEQVECLEIPLKAKPLVDHHRA